MTSGLSTAWGAGMSQKVSRRPRRDVTRRPAEASRRDAGVLSERAGEMGLVRKRGLDGDVHRHGVVALRWRRLCIGFIPLDPF